MKPVRVLVVDDSATMRGFIKAALERDPAIEVVGQAADPLEARQAIKTLNPDVVTLDVEMPNMNGIEFLDKIMRLRPMPVIMVSSLTTSGGDATIRALEIGAVDCVAKPSPGNEHAFDDLPTIVKMAAGAFVRPSASPRSAPPPSPFRESVQLCSRWTRRRDRLLHRRRRSADRGADANFPPIVRRPSSPSTCRPISPRALRNGSTGFARRPSPKPSTAPSSAQGHVYLAPGGQAHLEVVGVARPALPPARGRRRQRPPSVGRCAVLLRRQGGRRKGGRRHPDWDGPGRRRGIARDAQGRGAHVRAERSQQRRLRNAARWRLNAARSKDNCRSARWGTKYWLRPQCVHA